MARWALSPIIGDGTARVDPLNPTTTGPYRAAASDYGGHVAVIPGNDDGTPRYGWALVRFDDAADLAAAAQDTRLRVLPAWTLDHVVTAGEAAAIADALDHFGIAGYPDPTGRTVRQVLRWIADKLDVTWQVG
jgi:hypothetical protein